MDSSHKFINTKNAQPYPKFVAQFPSNDEIQPTFGHFSKSLHPLLEYLNLSTMYYPKD